DRLENAARALGLDEREKLWGARAREMRAEIESRGWNAKLGRFAATLDGADMDASLLQLVDPRFLADHDPRLLATLAAMERMLRRGTRVVRYATEDDLGLPETAFHFCTFWVIEALYRVRREKEARTLFDEMLERRTPAGLL